MFAWVSGPGGGGAHDQVHWASTPLRATALWPVLGISSSRRTCHGGGSRRSLRYHLLRAASTALYSLRGSLNSSLILLYFQAVRLDKDLHTPRQGGPSAWPFPRARPGFLRARPGAAHAPAAPPAPGLPKRPAAPPPNASADPPAVGAAAPGRRSPGARTGIGLIRGRRSSTKPGSVSRAQPESCPWRRAAARRSARSVPPRS